MVYSELKCCIFCYSCVQRQQWGSLINLPAYLFWMQVGVCLNIYVTPFVMALLKPPWKSGGVARLTARGRKGGDGVARGLLKVLSHPYISISVHTLHPHTQCTDDPFCQLYFSQVSQVEVIVEGILLKSGMWRQTLMALARTKARKGSHTFLIAIVITFIISIIRAQSDHTQHGYPIYTIFSWDTDLKEEWSGEERAPASQTMTPHVKNENRKTRLLSVTPRPHEMSPVKSPQTSFQSPPVPLSSEVNPLQPAH